MPSDDEISRVLAAAAALDDPTQPAPRGGLLRDRVYSRLLEWIVDGRLPPGTRMRDRDIAALIQVSRTPVREAIRRLEDEGFVVAEASRWTRVTDLDVAQAEQIYPIIWTLESLAMTSGGPWSREQIAELKTANEQLAAAVEDGDATGAARADSAFHDIIVSFADNTRLASIVGELKTHLRRLEVAYFAGAPAASRSVHEHQQAISALERGDLAAATQAITENWQRSLDRMRHHASSGHVDKV